MKQISPAGAAGRDSGAPSANQMRFLLCASLIGAASALRVGLAVRAPSRGAISMLDDGTDVLLEKFGLPKPDVLPTRRSAIGLGLTAAAAAAIPDIAAAADPMFTLPPLPYPYDALEPHIDAATMKFHHDFHHQAPPHPP